MPIKYVKGNLLDAKEGIIAHGCNAQGVMGAGVALAIKNKWPVAFQTYADWYSNFGLELGQVIWADVDDKLIANCITQETYGRQDGKVYVDYDAIRICMKNIRIGGGIIPLGTTDKSPLANVAMPKIGAGLGGGDWNKIEKIIENELRGFDVTVYEL